METNNGIDPVKHLNIPRLLKKVDYIRRMRDISRTRMIYEMGISVPTFNFIEKYADNNNILRVEKKTWEKFAKWLEQYDRQYE